MTVKANTNVVRDIHKHAQDGGVVNVLQEGWTKMCWFNLKQKKSLETVFIHRNLVYEAVGRCPSYQSRNGWLVRNIAEINIEMIFKHLYVSMVAVSQAYRHQIE